MSVFAKMLGKKVQSYIELRRSLGYAFKKQAGTLQAFVRHVESEQLGGPLTKGMALNFVLSFAGGHRKGGSRSISNYTTGSDIRLLLLGWCAREDIAVIYSSDGQGSAAAQVGFRAVDGRTRGCI